MSTTKIYPAKSSPVSAVNDVDQKKTRIYERLRTIKSYFQDTMNFINTEFNYTLGNMFDRYHLTCWQKQETNQSLCFLMLVYEYNSKSWMRSDPTQLGSTVATCK